MTYKEIYKNLFEVNKKYTLCQCISLDCEMGEGIATQFDKNFKGMKSYLKKYINENNPKHPVSILYDKKNQNVINLITKKKFNNKPTLNSLGACLIQMRDIIIENNIKYLAMPKIASGLDRLQWGEVREIIQDIFKDIDINILVCKY